MQQAAGQAMQDPQTSQRMARVFQGVAQGPHNRQGQGQGQVGSGPQSSPSDGAPGGGGLGAILGSLMQSLNVGSPGQAQGASLQSRAGTADVNASSSSSDWQSALVELDEEERNQWERTIRQSRRLRFL